KGEQGFRRVRLESLRILQSNLCRITASRTFVASEVEMRISARKRRPSDRKIGVKLHRAFIKTSGFPGWGAEGTAACSKSHAAQIGIVSFWIVCWFNRQGLLLATGELGLQRLRDSFGDLALDAKDVSQLPVIGVCPEVGISLRVNQLHTDPHLVGHFLHAALKNVRYAKLLGDLGEIGRLALILLGGSAWNYFQTRDAMQPRQ